MEKETVQTEQEAFYAEHDKYQQVQKTKGQNWWIDEYICIHGAGYVLYEERTVLLITQRRATNYVMDCEDYRSHDWQVVETAKT